MKRSGSPSTTNAPRQRTITTVVPADLPTVMGVRDYLTQVVLNLVLNAIDATDDQGRIHVAARAEDGWLVLSVEDDGRGISIADRCRLFQPFFTTKAHGTGLGLFVSRQILEDHAGALSFQSEPGQGSTFLVRLPAERSRSDDPAAGCGSVHRAASAGAACSSSSSRRSSRTRLNPRPHWPPRRAWEMTYP